MPALLLPQETFRTAQEAKRRDDFQARESFYAAFAKKTGFISANRVTVKMPFIFDLQNRHEKSPIMELALHDRG